MKLITDTLGLIVYTRRHWSIPSNNSVINYQNIWTTTPSITAWLKEQLPYFIDILQGMVKALVFGIIITILSCYFGFNASGGAEGVGRATTTAVVSSSVLILTSTYFITSFFI